MPFLSLLIAASSLSPMAIAYTADQAIFNSLWDACTPPPGRGAFYGCGAGLNCNYQSPQYSQCIPNSALQSRQWATCPSSEIGKNGGTGTFCPAGSFCEKVSRSCMPCRTRFTTCGPSSYNSNDYSCCPGYTCTSVQGFVLPAGTVASKHICLPNGAPRKRDVIESGYGNASNVTVAAAKDVASNSTNGQEGGIDKRAVRANYCYAGCYAASRNPTP